MRWFIKRALVVGFAGFAIAGLLTAPAAGVSGDFDAENVFCTSTIDPRCQPGNLPILIEAGIVSGGGTTASTATVAGGTAVAALPIAPGPFAWLLGGATTVVGADLALNQNGLTGGRIKTDPVYVQPATDLACSNVDGAPFAFTYQSFMAAPSLCLQQPLRNLNQPYYAPAGYLEIALGPVREIGQNPYPNNRQAMTWTIGNLSSPTPVEAGGALMVYCKNANTGVIEERATQPLTVTNTNYNQGSTGDLTCGDFGSGWQIVMVAWRHWHVDGNSLKGGVLWESTGTIGLPNTGGNTIDGTIGGSVKCVGPDGIIYERGINAPIVVTAGQDVVIPDVKCNGGDLAVETELDWTPAGSETPTSIVPPTAPLPQITELPTQYPDCFGAGALACKLTLWKLGTGGQLESCGSIGQLCLGWTAIPNPAQVYKCKYGPYDVDLNACSAYRNPEVGVLPNVDENGNWLPINTPPPNPLPNDTGTGTIPGGDPNNDNQSSECWPSGWGVLNPLSWVYQPIRCALEWAFVPRQSALTQTAVRVQTAWAGTSVMQGTMVATAVPAMLPQGANSDCRGPAVVFGSSLNEYGIGGTFYPLSACNEPWSTLASVSRIAIPILLAFVLFLAFTRYVAGVVGFGGLGSSSNREDS